MDDALTPQRLALDRRHRRRQRLSGRMRLGGRLSCCWVRGGDPWACVGGAIVTACECLPLIVEEFGGTECPFF
jgi:hypothetical protein